MQTLEKIKSFTVDHNVMQPGLYCLGQARGVYTYDLRFKKPNGGDYLAQAAMHSIEHMFATVARNGAHKDAVVYFGPMGCRTGFYLLMFDVAPDQIKPFVADTLRRCLALDCVPGTQAIECGNCSEHDLEGARKEIAAYLDALDS